jgi:hypothetical protein
MNGIVGAEMVPISERGGLSDQPIAHLQPDVARPVGIQLADEMPVLAGRKVAGPSPSRKGGSGLDVCGGRRGHDRRFGDVLSRRRGTRFLDVELHERAGIDVEPQRRSSRTVELTGLPRTRAGRVAPRGFPPPQDAIPSRTIPAIVSCSAGASGGDITATGRPRSVTVMRSPSATRRRNSLRRFFRTRTPTVVTSTALLVAT